MKKTKFRAEQSRRRSRSAGFQVKFLVATLLLALTLSACTQTFSTPTALPTVALDDNNSSPGKPSSNPDAVSASAFIVPLRQAELSFANVGRVKAVAVKVGEQVKTGQVLVELDTTLLEAKVREAEANLAAAQVQV